MNMGKALRVSIKAFSFCALLCCVDGSDAAFLFSLYHKIVWRARGFEANHAARRVYHPQLACGMESRRRSVWNHHEVMYGMSLQNRSVVFSQRIDLSLAMMSCENLPKKRVSNYAGNEAMYYAKNNFT